MSNAAEKYPHLLKPKTVRMSDRAYQVARDGSYRRSGPKPGKAERRQMVKYQELIRAIGSLAHARAMALENPAGPEADVFAKYKLSIDDLRRLESPEGLLEEILKRV